MKIGTVAISLAVALMAVGYLQGQASAKAGDSKIPWQHGSAAAFKLAKQTHKPLLVDFYFDACPSCKELDQKTYSDPKVIQAVGQFVPLKVDIDKKENASITKKYKAQFFPDIVFMDANGKVLHQFDGFKKPSEFLGEVSKALAKVRK